MPPIIIAIVWLIFAFVVLMLLASNIRIVPQAQAYVVERLGAYHSTWGVGLHFKIPLIEKVAKKISLKEQVVDFPPQPVITEEMCIRDSDQAVPARCDKAEKRRSKVWKREIICGDVTTDVMYRDERLMKRAGQALGKAHTCLLYTSRCV